MTASRGSSALLTRRRRPQPQNAPFYPRQHPSALAIRAGRTPVAPYAQPRLAWLVGTSSCRQIPLSLLQLSLPAVFLLLLRVLILHRAINTARQSRSRVVNHQLPRLIVISAVVIPFIYVRHLCIGHQLFHQSGRHPVVKRCLVNKND